MNDLPAHLRSLPRRNLAQAATENLGSARPPTLSIRDNRFTLVDAAGNMQPFTTMDKTGPYADVVIIDLLERVSRVYYEDDFPGEGAAYKPPDCWSDNGIGPSRQSEKPQSPTCANCPQAVWGSDTSRVTGKGIPACNTVQKLAVVVPGMGEHVFMLRVPPNSLKNFRAYAEQYRGHDFDMDVVVTRLSFQKLGTLQFAPIGYIDEATTQVVHKAISTKAADVMLGRHDVPKEGMALPANRPSAAIAHKPEVTQASPFAPQQSSSTQAAESANAQSPGHAISPNAVLPPAGRRRGRPPAQVTEQPTTVGGAPTAPFRPNPPPANTGFIPGASAGSGSAPFGIETKAAAPAGDIARDLNSVFGKAG